MTTLILLLALCAPLPFPKPTAPEPLPGVYSLYYCSQPYRVELWAGGEYRAWLDGVKGEPQWVGEWEQDGTAVRIRERPAGSTSPDWTLEFKTPVLKHDPYRDLPAVWMMRRR